MSWINEANAIVNATEGVVSEDSEKLKFKPYPEPASFIVEEGEELTVMNLLCYYLEEYGLPSAIKQ